MRYLLSLTPSLPRAARSFSLTFQQVLPMPEKAAQQLGLGILQRVAIREKARLQAHFLSRLYASPESGNIVLCGSMALHGVYLHGRWSKDLDFDAPMETALRFQEIAERCELTLKHRAEWKGHSSPQDAIPFIFASSSAFYSEVSIGVEIFSREQILVAPERHTFHASSGEQVSVLVKPLAEMIAVKLGCIFRRQKAVDFLDVWLGLQSNLCTHSEVRNLLRLGLCDAGDFSPPPRIDVSLALTQLEGLRPIWEEKLSIYKTQVPPFMQVYTDLAEWLPFFAETEH